MANETAKVKRPSSITLINLFAIYWGIMIFYYIARAGVQYLGILTIFIAIIGVAFLACGIGFWIMKKWAVDLCLILAIVSQVILLLTGTWNILSLGLSAIIVFIGYKNFSKMS
ncbi:MAG: hypothetical protein HUU11_14790 [Anaerolineales bacterium]|nr:hypothetical protein [Anaerolineales bacterium]NUQ85975.1 hypothetical protein [Anaerolineales bacterium]